MNRAASGPAAGGGVQADSDGDLEFRILGTLEVRRRGQLIDLGTPKQRAVLAVLLLEAGRVVSSDRLVRLLWDDAPKAMSSLQTYVSNLRRVLEPERRPRDGARVLVTEPPGYRLTVDPAALDWLRFEHQVELGKALLGEGDVAGAVVALDEALDTWTGPPLPELADEPFVVEARSRLGGVRLAAVSLAARARLDLGDHLGALTLLERTVAEHPLDERLHGLLALALYRSGRQADALRTIDRVRRALEEHVGLDLGPELRMLENDVLSQSPALDWTPVEVPAASAPRPEPSETRGAARPPLVDGPGLVGRSSDLDALTDRLSLAIGGRGGAVMIVGEPGIGKTRLAEELARIASDTGVTTAWARCPETGAVPPFWSVAQLAEQLTDAGVVPAVSAAVLEAGDDGGYSPTTLFEFHRAVAESLRSATGPLLLVIDDVQWADADSLRLVAHVAGELATTRVLLVVTSRMPGPDAEPAFVDGLDALTRSSGSLRIHLDGLGADAVAEWLRQRTDTDIPADVAALVHERTGGNPLFVKELSELLLAEGKLGELTAERAARAIPAGVQFVVRRRVSRLPQVTQRLLTVASVVGRTFDLDVVAAVTEHSLDDALDALEPALAAGLVADDEGGALRFSHALVAEALSAEVNAAGRARIHARTATCIADRAGPVLGRQAALVAHHALEGSLAGTAELAVRASVEAARVAAANFGYEDAAIHWGRAVAALERARPGDVAARIDALCELSAAQFRADLVDHATDAAIAAVELAETIGDSDSMRRAAVLLGSPHVWPNRSYGEVDPRPVTVLERTRARLDADDLRSHALVAGAIAVELTYADRAVWTAACDDAVAAARNSGEPDVLAQVLLNVAGPLRPSELERRMSDAREAIQLAEQHGLSPEIELTARFNLALGHNESADLDAAHRESERCVEIVERIGGAAVRAQLGWFRAGLELARGRHEMALRVGREATEIFRRTRGQHSEVAALAIEATVTADLGGLDLLSERLAAVLGQSPVYSRLVMEFTAWVLMENGRLEEAAQVLRSIDGSLPISDDYTTLVTASMATHLRASVGDLDGVATVMGQLEPYSGRWAAAGSSGCVVGLVDLALARGAATLGRHDDAHRWFDAAVVGHERLRAPGWLARSLLHQGQFLVEHGTASDRTAGRAAIARAAAIAESHGLTNIARQVAERTSGH
jgi:DNA-binding SARP family transcriptional activator